MTEKVNWYLPVSEVADMLDCHWRRVYELINEGALEFIVLRPKRVAVSKDSVQRYLEARSGNGGTYRAES